MATKVLVKDGKLATYGGKVVEVEATSAEAIEWHQCPEPVRNYLANVSYDPSDYTSSAIETYAAGDVQSNPNGVQAGGVAHYNEVPNVETPWAAGGKAGTLKPLDAVRWIKSPTRNARDLGGWPCDGGTVQYGKLFRGGEVATSDTEFVRTLHDEIGIRAELELQGTDVAEDYSVIGSDVDFCCPTDGGSYWAYYSITSKASMRQAFRFIFDSVARGRPVYFHCSAGADRTGTIACLIEALLGMSQSDIDRDYELTSFNGATYLRKRCGREYAADQWEYGYKNLITAITALSGQTFRDKVVNYIASLGFTAAEINGFRAAMIDGTPATVLPVVATYTVSKSISGVEISNSATSATQYQPYSAEIAPTGGKVISSVKVMMGGQDVTAEVFSGTQAIRRHAVTKTLKNCTIDNAKKAAADGEGYGATITPVGGYTLTGATITIMMGGVDVSTYYSGGKIAIPSVTGDIAITVTAVPTTPAYTNLFDPSGIHAGYRINSGAALEANSSQNVSNDIELGGSGVTVRIKGSKANTDASTYRICYFNGKTWTGAIHLQNAEGYAYDAVTDTITFTSNSNTLYTKLRFSYPSTTDSAAIVVTVNEAIE